VRLDKAKAWPPFYFYYFRSPAGRKNIEAIVEQVAAAGIRGSDLARLRVLNPPLSDQHVISELLTALDDKITANERIILLLDEWIRSGFVTMTGQFRPLGDFASNIRNQVQPLDVTPSTPYFGLEHIPRRRMWASVVGAASDVTSAKSAFQESDILFGKLRPYFHKVISAASSGICSTDILVVRSDDPELAGFVLAACASDDTVRACTAASQGTRMPRTSWKDLRPVPIVWPGESAARAFSADVSLKSSLANGLIRESHRLANTRDELLPLLMSGKIRVRDAEKVVEGVV
jgi:type I restriction enzyme S subunit